MRRSYLVFIVVAAALALALPGYAQMGKQDVGARALPPNLNDVGFDQRLGQSIPLQLPFYDEAGRTVRLKDYFHPGKPVILSLVYYECPMLCTETLNGLAGALRMVKFDLGNQYEVITVSFDPREKPELAAAKKKAYLERYGRPGGEQGWHFLTGDLESIAALTNSVGFHYQWDKSVQQFAHATGIMVLTPEGRIAQYFYGVEYAPKDLRLGLVEASQNKIGTLVDQVLLYCYHYDPRTGKYGAVVMNILRVAGAVTVLILGGFLIFLFRYDPKRAEARFTPPSGKTQDVQRTHEYTERVG